MVTICLLSLLAILPARAQLKFVENRGQWPDKVLFRADLSSGALFLTDSGLLFSLREESAAEKAHSRSYEKFTYKGHAFYLHFKGASYKNIEQKQPSAEYYNYYLGPDPAHWKSGIHAAGELMVHDLYPGIDLQLLEENGTLKYNLICRMPENISLIRFNYLGVDGLDMTFNKITVKTSVGDFVEAMPLVYGFGGDGAETHEILAKYKQGEDGYFSFDLAKNKYAKVVIDPILVFSTYSGSPANNFGCTGTYDELGNGFAGGTVFANGLPTSVGAFQKTFGGGTFENLGYGDGRDAAILKFSPNGSTLVYGTYLGGNDNEQPHSMVTNNKDELYVMGSTKSANFPIKGGTGKGHAGMYDFFVAHFSADGTQLLNSTYVGAAQNDGVGADRGAEPIDNFPLLYNYADEFRGEIITDQNNIYVAGLTYSPNFPKSNNSLFFGGKEDAVLFSMPADLSKLNWSQIIGSTGYEAFYGVALGKHGDIFAAGASTSADLPAKLTTFANAYLGGMADALLMRFNVASGQRLNGTFAGTAEYEQAYFVQTDNSGNPYIYGQTEGPVPNLNAKYHMNATGQFIIRFDSLLSKVTLSSSFGTIGNRPNISPTAFLVDQCERIFISGWGGDANSNLIDAQLSTDKQHRNRGNTRNLPLTTDAAQKKTDGSDFYLAVFSKGMNSLLYATYFGGIGVVPDFADEHVDGGTSRFDKKGIIYQSVCAGCQRNSLFPTTASAYSKTNRSLCNNALFKIDFQNLNRVPVMKDTFIQVISGDLISYQSIATDVDMDSVYMQYRWISKGGATGADTAKVIIQKGLGQATMSLVWNTQCSNSNLDTALLELKMWDRGCPNSDTSYAHVMILILPPPIIIPPNAICLSFERGDTVLEIAWPDMTQAAAAVPYFKYFILSRTNPDNSVTVLDTLLTFTAGTLKDGGILDPVDNNYCYRIEGVNTCDVHISPLADFCTIRELRNPIQGVQINYVSVEMDRRVVVAWNKSPEPDLKHYELYKYRKGDEPDPKDPPFVITSDSFFIDSFDVDFENWCYRILVTDECGHFSGFSNPGCNVIINGTTVGRPDYVFNLAWQNYVGWDWGISDWEVERQYSSKPWSLLASTGKNQVHKDDQLDYYDWGGYWYRTNAISNPDSAGHVFRSQSNWIYLFQKPELWVPNAFTPDENKKNDQWGIFPVFVRNYHLLVYNRWGEKVWETRDRKAQWDGMANGKASRDAVFAWKVEFDGWDDKTYKMTGTVILLH